MARVEKVRIAKLMAQRGMCSRREADAYIQRGWVRVDGVVVTELGSKAFPHQKITLNKQAQNRQTGQVTILLNKPVGYVSHRSNKGHRPAAQLITADRLYRRAGAAHSFSRAHLQGLAPAGRLDIDSQGMLVLTQDGRIARQLIDQHSEIEREYLVRVRGHIGKGGLARLNHGLSLDGQ